MSTTKKQLVQEFRMQAIREAASRVVSDQGVAGATVEAIAAEAGIAKGTIYLYFKNREDLLERAADHALDELLAELGALVDAKETFDAQLRRFVRSALGFFDENRQFFRLYQAAGQSMGREEADCRSRRYDEYFTRVSAWIKRAISAGEVRPLDADRVSLVLSEALTAVIRRRRLEEPPPPIDADTEWLASLFLYGALTPHKERT
jgi:AcrR family transcriptional regulator